jgi:hypothetical protein
VKEILLTQGKVAVVDDADYDRLACWKWRYRDGYAVRSAPRVPGVSRKTIYMHREIMGTPCGMETDHANGNKLYNLRSNLRVCTSSENKMNREKHRDGASGYKGATFDKSRNKWQSKITVNKHIVYLGRYDTPEEAAQAYDAAAMRLHGEFAKTNFATESQNA